MPNSMPSSIPIDPDDEVSGFKRFLSWIYRLIAIGLVGGLVLVVYIADQQLHHRNGYGHNPFAGATLYGNDPSTDAAKYLKAHPDATWIKPYIQVPKTHPIASKADIEGFADWLATVPQGTLPQVSIYRIPNRDCGNFSRSGSDALTNESYHEFISRFITVAGQREMVIYLEQDAVTAPCFNLDRANLLKKEARRLSQAGFAVYLDGGNPNDSVSLDVTARRLIDAGVAQTRGFFVNQAVSYTTDESLRFGNDLSRMLANNDLDMHFVIDTSRNGQGPPTDHTTKNWWCNNSELGLGEQPHAITDQEQLDAAVWIKNPDRSDGYCHKPGDKTGPDPINGDPAPTRSNPGGAGIFYPEYLRRLIDQAQPPL